MRIVEQLLDRLDAEGCPARIVPARHLADLRQTLGDLQRQGLFDADFYDKNLTSFSFEKPSGQSSLIIVAVPSPARPVTFSWKDKIRTIPIPPTYIGYERIANDVETSVSNTLAPFGYHASRARLPLKTLAVCSGLGTYGRNNVCYVPGLGSYHELVGLISDLPASEEPWQAPKMMDRCASCHICEWSCPTAAIGSDRVLLHAEKCVTLYNEMPGKVPFPDWMPATAHNALVGCMLCQKLCPENRKLIDPPGAIEQFSSAETDLILEGVPYEQFPGMMRDKIDRMDLNYSMEILSRNLRAIFSTAP